MNGDDVIYFDCFGVEDIPKIIIKLISNKNITINIYTSYIYRILAAYCQQYMDTVVLDMFYVKS